MPLHSGASNSYSFFPLTSAGLVLLQRGLPLVGEDEFRLSVVHAVSIPAAMTAAAVFLMRLVVQPDVTTAVSTPKEMSISPNAARRQM